MAKIIELGLLEEDHPFISKGFRVARMIKATKKQNKNTNNDELLFNEGDIDGNEGFEGTICNSEKYQEIKQFIDEKGGEI